MGGVSAKTAQRKEEREGRLRERASHKTAGLYECRELLTVYVVVVGHCIVRPREIQG